MPGGILNLVSEGQPNVILNSNPSKTFFKCTYKKYTNFGLQKFRVDYEGSRMLSLTDYTEYIFKIPRYGDLLMDSYLVVRLPDIWSPIIPPLNNTTNTQWAPYDFRWIKNIGAKMIHRIQITCGSQLLNEYSGDYLLAMAQRDFTVDQLEKFNKMIGEIPELTSPENAHSRNNVYPSAFWNNGDLMEPSISAHDLYIPLNSWFCLNSQQAFPLTALQYNELNIKITFRPIFELFQIRDVLDGVNNYPYVAPNVNNEYMQFYRFTQPPPDISLQACSYIDTNNRWDSSSIYLNCTYAFLSDDERNLFAQNEQKYLFKKLHETIFYNIAGQTRIDIKSLGMVATHTFYFQRSDANLRNEWSNYTNWPYDYLPANIIPATTQGSYVVPYINGNTETTIKLNGPGVNTDHSLTGFYVTPLLNVQNIKEILVSLAILFDGAYRENTQLAGVYNYIEKYIRTTGNAPDGLYVYNYGLHSNYDDLQPSGAVNMSRFTKIEFEIVTINPPLDPCAVAIPVCDPISGAFVTGINKPSWRIYLYTYDLHLFEERYNMVSFVSGNCGLLWAS
jgi:hypothetical protein